MLVLVPPRKGMARPITNPDYPAGPCGFDPSSGGCLLWQLARIWAKACRN